MDPDIALTSYSARFLSECKARGVKPKTIERWEGALRLHVLPRLGRLKVREIKRAMVKELLIAKLDDETSSMQGQKGDRPVGRRRLARGTVRHLLGTMNAILGSAVEDGLITANPLQKLGQKLNLGTKKDKTKPKALDAVQLGQFLTTARMEAPDLYPPSR